MKTAHFPLGACLAATLALLFACPVFGAESVESLTAELAEAEKAQGPEHENVANILGRLAEAHRQAGDSAKAEPLYERALGIYEKAHGPDALPLAVILNNWGQSYAAEGKYDKAEPHYRRALTICEKARPEHADTATVAANLAMLYQNRNQLDQAEPLYRQALTIREKALGADSPEVAATIANLVALYRAQNDDVQINQLRFNYPNAVEAAEQSAVAPEQTAENVDADTPSVGDMDTAEEAAEENAEEPGDEAGDETVEADETDDATAEEAEAEEPGDDEQDMEAEDAEEAEEVEEN